MSTLSAGWQIQRSSWHSQKKAKKGKKVRPALTLRAEIDLPARTPCDNFLKANTYCALHFKKQLLSGVVNPELQFQFQEKEEKAKKHLKIKGLKQKNKNQLGHVVTTLM
jgi:hypothetical protein